MVRFSNSQITILNSLTLACSIIAIGYSIWLASHPGTSCQRVIQRPLLYLGLSLFVVSLPGIIGSGCHVSFILSLYLLVMFALVLGLIAFTLFSVVVTNKGVGKGFKEHRIGDYSNWLKKYVINGKNWDQIKSCIDDVHVCSSLSLHKDGGKHPLSALQSGCCKPPTYCGFQFVNATFWIAPNKGPAAELPNNDCTSWSNNQNRLCFDSNSCKAGVLNNIRREGRLVAIINICITILVIIVYLVACCALRNNREA